MPIIKTPDGRKLRVPEGATQEQVNQFLASAGYQPGGPAPATGGPGSPPGAGVAAPIAGGRPAASPARSLEELMPGVSTDPTEGMSRTGRVLAGVGQANASTVRGARQLFNYLTGDEKEYAQLQEAENQARVQDEALLGDRWGRGGQILGHLAQAAAPGTLLAKGTKLLGGGAKALIAGESALGAGMGSVQPTVKGEDHSDNALWGAALGAAIPFGGAAFSKIRQLPATTIEMGLRALAPHGMRQVGNVLARSAKLGSPKIRKQAGIEIGEITKDVRVPVGTDLAAALRKVAGRYKESLDGTDAMRSIKGMISIGVQQKGAKLKGAELSEFLTALGREAKASEGFKQTGLEKTYRILNDAMMASMTKAQVKQLLKAREMYKTGTRPPKITVPGLGSSATRGIIQGLRTGEMSPNEQDEGNSNAP